MSIEAPFKGILEKLGLNPVEQRVFFANIKTGSAAASEIAKVADLNRVTAYEALKRLSKKGLVRIMAKKNSSVKYFVPVDIADLEHKLEQQKTSSELALQELQKIKPELAPLFIGRLDKPEVLFYEGLTGIRGAIYDTVKQKPKELLSFSNSENFNDVYGLNFLQKYWDKRKALGIVTKGLIPKTQKAVKFYNSERNQKDLRIVKYISQEWYRFNDEIDIYGDNVAISSLQTGNEHTVIIRSRTIASAFRTLFELVWSMVP